MIDFPANPTNGQQYTAAGVTWVWDGTKWTPAGASSAVVQAMNDNRVINGDMRIDQRFNGSNNLGQGYTIDRWALWSSPSGLGVSQRTNGTGNALNAGFPYVFVFTSSSAHTLAAADYCGVTQSLEGDAISDFAWGTSAAQPVTLSFWATSSLTGTFSGSIRNFANTRAYPFSFSLSSQYVYQKIVITIPGDTTGTWVTSGNAGGLIVGFDLGCGATYRGPANAWASSAFIGVTGSQSVVATNGATFYVTGVKLEIGSIATPFNRQSLAKSLADCQRYFEMSYDIGVVPGTANGAGAVLYLLLNGLSSATNQSGATIMYKSTKRAVPTLTLYSDVTGASGKLRDHVNSADVTPGSNSYMSGFQWWASSSAASVYYNMSGHWTASAEL